MWPLYNEGPKVWQGIGYNEVSLYWGSFSLLLLLPRQRMLLVITRTLHIEVCYIGATVIMCTVFFAHKCLKQDSYFYIYRLEQGFKFISVCLEQVHGKIEGSTLHPLPPPPGPMSNLSILEVQLYRNIQENQEDLRKKHHWKAEAKKTTDHRICVSWLHIILPT